MSDPSDLDRASQEVEAGMEDLGDLESVPGLPSSTLAAHAARSRGEPSSPVPEASVTSEILRLAWPVMMSGALISLTGIVDRIMIGHLESEYGAAVPLAAVSYASQFFFLIQSTLFAIGLACVALMARSIGAGDPRRARQALAASLQVAVVVTSLMMGVMFLGARSALGFLGAEDVVVDVAIPYLNYIIASSMLLAIAITLESALRANKNTRTPMVIAGLVASVKLVGNYALIYGEFGAPALGLEGAGMATAISQAAGVLLLIAIVARAPATSPVHLSLRDLLAVGELRSQVIRIALPGIAERIIMNLALLSYFWVLSNYYGTLAVAVYGVGVPLLSFSWLPGTGYAQACSTLVGQLLGAGDPARATRTGWISARLAIVTAIVMGVACVLFREPLAGLFTDDADVIAGLGPFMLALAIGQPFLQLHFTLGGAHRGAGDTYTPLVAATVGNWVFRVPLACLFAAVLGWSVEWVWYSLIFDHMARSVILLWSYRRGRWQHAFDRPRRR